MRSLLLPLIAAIVFPTASNADIRSNCFSKWGKDYKMVEYCMNQQSGALQRIGGEIYNNNNFDSRKNSKIINDLPCSNFIIADKKRLA